MEFARFLGLPPADAHQNVTDIADAVCHVLIDACTDPVIVDEIHNLNLGTAAGEDPAPAAANSPAGAASSPPTLPLLRGMAPTGHGAASEILWLCRCLHVECS